MDILPGSSVRGAARSGTLASAVARSNRRLCFLRYISTTLTVRRCSHVAKADSPRNVPAYVTELAPPSVNFTLYFRVKSQQANVLAVSDRVATAVKLALDAAQIDMPFPHTVVLFHDATGSSRPTARPGWRRVTF